MPNEIKDASIGRVSSFVNEVTSYTFLFKGTNPFDAVKIGLPVSSQALLPTNLQCTVNGQSRVCLKNEADLSL